MEKLIKGDIVVIPFPFSDLSDSKRRPAFVLADLQGDDVILCQITSQNVKDAYAISLNEIDFVKGSLNQQSNIRPNRLFTASKIIIVKKIGSVSNTLSNKVIDKLFEILK
ncbi:MAG: type II toxin-antitoxin system PemK/MazF family toxin [Bacteroidales bacterium]|jgi:mRNA interferase MazF